VVVELIPGGAVLDLGRREAEVAVRPFRSTQGDLVARRVADVSYGLYASADYLARRPLKHARELAAHAVLASDAPKDLERRWLARLAPNVKPAFVSPLSSALLEAARASAGVAVLPRYLADAEPSLRRVPMPDAPVEPLWLTVHRDLKQTPRVRSLLDFLIAAMRADAPRFEGR
jgi:DNA-binding transcriptional LysR family regulator